mmetsp:Transcript_36830/g.35546  ORF Transcript_36830/g.35546 Transcript_36830/m.35546 type:complete len:234 (+) Transcript_36830:691-1392(+)
MVIEPLKKLTHLEVLGLFHNEIMNEEKTTDILEGFPSLSELSIDGNPVSANVAFKYKVILKLKKLTLLDDELVQELDRDVAEQYFLTNNLPLPSKEDPGKLTVNENKAEEKLEGEDDQENMGKKKTKKQVKFHKGSVDDLDNAWQNDEIKKLEAMVAEFIVENDTLKQQLQKKHYDEVYKENKMLQMEVKNMYILQEQNRDLKEDLERLQQTTYEDRMKRILEENEYLKKRNG